MSVKSLEEVLKDALGWDWQSAAGVPSSDVVVQDIVDEVRRHFIVMVPWEMPGWGDAIHAERQHQIAVGYTNESDLEAGPDHLVVWAVEYIRRGEQVKAAAILDSLRTVLDQMIREAKAEAWDEGWTASESYDGHYAVPRNPYRDGDA